MHVLDIDFVDELAALFQFTVDHGGRITTINFYIFKTDIFHRIVMIPQLHRQCAEPLVPIRLREAHRAVDERDVFDVVIGFPHHAVAESLIRPAIVIAESDVVRVSLRRGGLRFHRVVARAHETLCHQRVAAVGKHDPVRIGAVAEQ